MCTQSDDLSEHTHAWDRGVMGGGRNHVLALRLFRAQREKQTHWMGRREVHLSLPEEVRKAVWRRSWERNGDQIEERHPGRRQLSADRHLEEPSRAALLRKDQVAQEPPTHAYAFVMLQSVVLLCS